LFDPALLFIGWSGEKAIDLDVNNFKTAQSHGVT